MTRPMVDILSRNSLVPSSTPSQATNLSPTISIRILVEKIVKRTSHYIVLAIIGRHKEFVFICFKILNLMNFFTDRRQTI